MTAADRVTTAAELDALPVGRVVLGADGHPWQRALRSMDTTQSWRTLGFHAYFSATASGLLPATVLHPRPDDPRDAEIARDAAAYRAEREFARAQRDATLGHLREVEAERDRALDDLRALREAVGRIADEACADLLGRAGNATANLIGQHLRAALAEHPAPEPEPGRRDALTVTREQVDAAAEALRGFEPTEYNGAASLTRGWRTRAASTVATALGLTVTDGGGDRG